MKRCNSQITCHFIIDLSLEKIRYDMFLKNLLNWAELTIKDLYYSVNTLAYKKSL